MPAPPKAIALAIADIKYFQGDDCADEIELVQKFDAVHAGWDKVAPVKRQPTRNGRSKRPERNWQAARQNGPKPLVIGKGPKVEPIAVAEPKPVGKVEKGLSFAKAPAFSVASVL